MEAIVRWFIVTVTLSDTHIPQIITPGVTSHGYRLLLFEDPKHIPRYAVCDGAVRIDSAATIVLPAHVRHMGCGCSSMTLPVLVDLPSKHDALRHSLSSYSVRA